VDAGLGYSAGLAGEGSLRTAEAEVFLLRKTTTASVPFGQAGAVTYGLNVNATAIALSSAGNVPVERTAMPMAALLGSPVSSGFVVRAHERFADKLDAAGFDGAMRDALAACHNFRVSQR
jgi:hypothetical protein